MIEVRDVKVATHRLETRLESASNRCQNQRHPAVESRPGCVAACFHRYHPGTGGLTAGSRTGLGTPPAATTSPESADTFAAPQETGGRRQALPNWKSKKRSWLCGSNGLGRRESWSFHLSRLGWPKSWAGKSPPRWCTVSWRGTSGGYPRPVRATRKAIRRPRRSGEKLPQTLLGARPPGDP